MTSVLLAVPPLGVITWMYTNMSSATIPMYTAAVEMFSRIIGRITCTDSRRAPAAVQARGFDDLRGIELIAATNSTM